MRFRRPSGPRAGIDIAPLVDVVFLLVIFFAATTTFLESAGLDLELPSSTSTARHEPGTVTVSLGADGVLAIDGDVVGGDQLEPRLRTALEARERKLVQLRADARARHGDVVRVMDAIRAAGAEGLTVEAKSDSD